MTSTVFKFLPSSGICHVLSGILCRKGPELCVLACHLEKRMEEDDMSRQLEEIQALQAVYGESAVHVANCVWTIPISSTVDLILSLPTHYPSCHAPIPTVRCFGLDPHTKSKLEADLLDMWEADMEVAVMWAEHLRSFFSELEHDHEEAHEVKISEPMTNTPPPPPRKAIVYSCVTTNHLLDHKPDNLLAMGRKYKVSGYYKYGSPGIAICWCLDRVSLDNFMDALERVMPQKKFNVVFEREWAGDTLPNDSGWTECATPSELQAAMEMSGCPGHDYSMSQGLDPSTFKRKEQNCAKSKGNSLSARSRRL